MCRRMLHVVLVLLLVVAFALPPRASAAAVIDPALQAVLARASSADQVEAVVNYDPRHTTGATLEAAIRDLGAGTITYPHLDSTGVVGTAQQINRVAALTGVTEVYANAPLQYYLHESVPFVGADRAWSDLGATGTGIGVAVIDTGVDGTHPDVAFGSKTVQNVKVVADTREVVSFGDARASQSLYVEDQVNTDTSSGHGTHVAGTAAGTGAASDGYYTGVAKEAHLVGIGMGDALFVFWALAGFDYLIANASRYNIKVVNNSWGTTRTAAEFDPNDPINRASKKAQEQGITVVFAAGNSGPAEDTMNHYAMAPWVIGVAAGCKPQDKAHCPDDPDGPHGHGLLADFSSRGVPGDPRSYPTLTAPGAHIVAARALTGTAMTVLDGPHDASVCNTRFVTRYTCASGTSRASPHVAGTVALMQQAAGGQLSPDQVKDILTQTALPMHKAAGTAYGPWEVGAGYLDAYAAVSASR
jgi:serine protease AprX